MKSVIELDPEYHLSLEKFTIQDEFDPEEFLSTTGVTLDSAEVQAEMNNTGYLNEVQEHDYLSKIPGLNSAHLMKGITFEK